MEKASFNCLCLWWHQGDAFIRLSLCIRNNTDSSTSAMRPHHAFNNLILSIAPSTENISKLCVFQVLWGAPDRRQWLISFWLDNVSKRKDCDSPPLLSVLYSQLAMNCIVLLSLYAIPTTWLITKISSIMAVCHLILCGTHCNRTLEIIDLLQHRLEQMVFRADIEEYFVTSRFWYTGVIRDMCI